MNLKSPHVTVLHLASVVSIYAHASPMLFEVNVRGTRHLLDRSMAHGVDRFVYCGSVHALPVPDDPETIITEVDHYDPNLVVGDYAKSKAMAAEMVLDASRNGLDASVVLPAGIIGPYDYLGNSISGLLKRVVDRKLPAMIGGGYNFVSVKDVANGIIAAAERGRSGESYILSGHEVDALDMVNFVAQMTGRRTFRHLAPMWIARLIAPITEWLSKQTGRRPVLTPYSLYTLTSPRHFSHDKATRELGYTVRPLEETLTAMVRFMADNHQFKTAVVFENGS
jgi:dihydroflavonol-4-reductase